jgi:hypothetical protein
MVEQDNIEIERYHASFSGGIIIDIDPDFSLGRVGHFAYWNPAL